MINADKFIWISTNAPWIIMREYWIMHRELCFVYIKWHTMNNFAWISNITPWIMFREPQLRTQFTFHVEYSLLPINCAYWIILSFLFDIAATHPFYVYIFVIFTVYSFNCLYSSIIIFGLSKKNCIILIHQLTIIVNARVSRLCSELLNL